MTAIPGCRTLERKAVKSMARSCVIPCLVRGRPKAARPHAGAALAPHTGQTRATPREFARYSKGEFLNW